MDKLQDMKEEFEDIRARFDGTRLIEFCLSNFDLLIQEVERLQTESQLDKFLIGEQEHVTHMQEKEIEKLREENEDYRMKYENIGAIFGKRNMLNKIEDLEKENQRYEQVLEEIVKEDIVYYPQALKIQKIAQKALERVDKE
jgi:hypothetical protein